MALEIAHAPILERSDPLEQHRGAVGARLIEQVLETHHQGLYTFACSDTALSFTLMSENLGIRAAIGKRHCNRSWIRRFALSASALLVSSGDELVMTSKAEERQARGTEWHARVAHEADIVPAFAHGPYLGTSSAVVVSRTRGRFTAT